MRGTVSKRLYKQAKKETVGQDIYVTRERKQELKAAHISAQRAKFIKPVQQSKRQQRLAA